MRVNFLLLFALILPAFSSAQSATSRPQSASTRLTQCLIDHTTESEKVNLVRFYLLAHAAHPKLKDLFINYQSEFEKSSKEKGDSLTRLITTTCVREARNVLNFESFEAIGRSVSELGTTASEEMMSQKDVDALLVTSAKHFDVVKLREALEKE